MAKVKPKRHTPLIDMTAMVDVAFLLLTFFILTTKFRPEESIQVDTPSAISELAVSELDIMIISVDAHGKVFVGFGDQNTREKVIDYIIEDYGLDLTESGKAYFQLQSNFGIPISQLEYWLNLPLEQRKKFEESGGLAGVPYPFMPHQAYARENELMKWIYYGRMANHDNLKFQFAIKGDMDSPYDAIQEVIWSLQEWNVNKFQLVTSLEAGKVIAPEKYLRKAKIKKEAPKEGGK